jgi:hypothetical protein
VAVILTRYGQPEATVVAACCSRRSRTCCATARARPACARAGDKFGADAVDAALGAARRRYDDDGVELSHEEQRADALDAPRRAGEATRWAFAAHEVHDASALAADLRRTQFPDAVWGRFAEGRGPRARWYTAAADGLTAAGFDARIAEELRAAAEALVEHAGAQAGR